jgi:hypothetical protein
VAGARQLREVDMMPESWLGDRWQLCGLEIAQSALMYLHNSLPFIPLDILFVENILRRALQAFAGQPFAIIILGKEVDAARN